MALGNALLAPRDIPLQHGAPFIVHEGHQRLVQHVFDPVAEHVRHFGIDKAGARASVDFPDALFGAVHDAAKALFAAFERGQLALGRLQHHPERLPAAVGAGHQGHRKTVLLAPAQQLQLEPLGLAAVQRALHEAIEIGQEGGADERAEMMLGRLFARDAEQVGTDQVHLQHRGVEAEHEIADRRQQIDIVKISLLAFEAQALRAEHGVVEATAEGIGRQVRRTAHRGDHGVMGKQPGRHLLVFIHLVPSRGKRRRAVGAPSHLS